MHQWCRWAGASSHPASASCAAGTEGLPERWLIDCFSFCVRSHNGRQPFPQGVARLMKPSAPPPSPGGFFVGLAAACAACCLGALARRTSMRTRPGGTLPAATLESSS